MNFWGISTAFLVPKTHKNPLFLARCSRASHGPSLPWCAMWEAESVDPPGVIFMVERGRFRQSLAAWNRGLATSLLSELIFTCFSPTNLCRLGKKTSKSYPAFWPKSSWLFASPLHKFLHPESCFPGFYPGCQSFSCVFASPPFFLGDDLLVKQRGWPCYTIAPPTKTPHPSWILGNFLLRGILRMSPRSPKIWGEWPNLIWAIHEIYL